MLARTAARMATAVDRPAVRYTIAVLAVAAAIAARMALGMVVEAPIYFTTFLPAILVTSGYAGDQAEPVGAPWPVLRRSFSGEQLAAALHATLQTRPAA